MAITTNSSISVNPGESSTERAFSMNRGKEKFVCFEKFSSCETRDSSNFPGNLHHGDSRERFDCGPERLVL
jgi:hypothetical protein